MCWSPYHYVVQRDPSTSAIEELDLESEIGCQSWTNGVLGLEVAGQRVDEADAMKEMTKSRDDLTSMLQAAN